MAKATKKKVKPKAKPKSKPLAKKLPAVKQKHQRIITIGEYARTQFKQLQRIEFDYFDDRFYKFLLPPTHNIDLSILHPNLIEFNEEGTYLYLPSVTTIIGATEKNAILDKWKATVGIMQAEAISKRALKKGSVIHEAIDFYTKGTHALVYQDRFKMNIKDSEIKSFYKKYGIQPYVIDDQEEFIQLHRFQQILKLLKPEILVNESNVHNLEHFYAGTTDGIWYLKKGYYPITSNRKGSLDFIPEDGYYIIDYKTGKGFDKKYTGIQLASYRNCFAPEYAEQIVGGIGVHLNDQNTRSGIHGAKLHFYNKTQLAEHYEYFQHLKYLYNANAPALPKRYNFPFLLFNESIKIKKPKAKKS